jgi:hypothetical protein
VRASQVTPHDPAPSDNYFNGPPNFVLDVFPGDDKLDLNTGVIVLSNIA